MFTDVYKRSQWLKLDSMTVSEAHSNIEHWKEIGAARKLERVVDNAAEFVAMRLDDLEGRVVVASATGRGEEVTKLQEQIKNHTADFTFLVSVLKVLNDASAKEFGIRMADYLRRRDQ